MANIAKKEDAYPKVLILGEWRKVLGSHPENASGQLERDRKFGEELTKQLVVELRTAC